MSVNGKAAQTTTEDADNYTFSINGDITSITLAGSASIRIYSITVNYSPKPTVTLDPAEIAFGNAVLGASVATQEFAILGENLKSALTATSSNTSVFTVAVKEGDSLTPDEGEVLASIIVTPITTAYGNFNETIKINGGGLGTDTAIVNVSMHVGGIVTVSPASPNLAFGDVPQNATAADYAKTITVSATHLTANKEIRVQAPAYFQASPTALFADENGVIDETEVKLMPITTNDAGDYGDVDAKFEIICTSPREFADIELGAPTMTIVSCSPLAAPTFDNGNSTISYTTATLAWTAVSGATKYIVNVTEHDGAAKITDRNTTELSVEMTELKANTRYDYTIQTIGNGTTTCTSSGTLSSYFTTQAYLDATLLLSENGAVHEFEAGEDHKEFEIVTLPSTVSKGIDDKVFVGWSADADRATAPEYAKGASYTLDAGEQTLYAVYATKSGEDGPAVNTVLWSEDFEGYGTAATPSAPSSGKVYGDAVVGYSYKDGDSATKIYDDSNGPNGSTSAKKRNLLVGKNNGSFTVSGIPVCHAVSLTFTYGKAGSGTETVSIPTSGVSLSDGTITFTKSVSAFDIVISNATSSNYRIDDLEVKVKTTQTASYSNYATTGAYTPTGFEDVEDSVKAVKVLRNGVLYIEKAGKTYNAQGQLVK